jgi:hypothetical protein
MFRRIEFIRAGEVVEDAGWPPTIGGLLVAQGNKEFDIWINELSGTDRTLPPNCRFYFTEKGWHEVGRKVAAVARQTGREYRVLAIKETDAQVVWRDKHMDREVAIQPPRKRPVSRDIARR